MQLIFQINQTRQMWILKATDSIFSMIKLVNYFIQIVSLFSLCRD